MISSERLQLHLNSHITTESLFPTLRIRLITTVAKISGAIVGVIYNYYNTTKIYNYSYVAAVGQYLATQLVCNNHNLINDAYRIIIMFMCSTRNCYFKSVPQM